MGLNKSTGNMYSFLDYTWNTVKGQCPHDCTYCYMKRWGSLNPVRFDRKELKTDLGKDNFIFVGSSCDMFADDIPAVWIEDTLTHCYAYKNRYLFQSKNPKRMVYFFDEYESPDIVVCTTIETNRWYPEIMNNSPRPEERARAMHHLAFTRYVTIEPIMDFDLEQMVDLIRWCAPKQVNIGADSGNNNLPEPSIDKVMTLIERLKEFTVISKKKNLKRLVAAN